MRQKSVSGFILGIITVIFVLTLSVNVIASTTNDSLLVLVPPKATEPVEITEPVQAETEPILKTEPTVPKETVPTKHEENYPGVPYYFQTDYPDTPYGDFGTVSTHGCGITSIAMVATYLTDEELPPDVLAERYGDYNTDVGSKWVLFEDSAEDLGLTIINQTWDVRLVAEALKNGSVVIACCTSDSIFTDGGHFIVLTGITSDGKFLVHDPYKGNYTCDNAVLKDGFENGFAQKYFWACHPMWIYAPKGENAIDLNPEAYAEN